MTTDYTMSHPDNKDDEFAAGELALAQKEPSDSQWTLTVLDGDNRLIVEGTDTLLENDLDPRRFAEIWLGLQEDLCAIDLGEQPADAQNASAARAAEPMRPLDAARETLSAAIDRIRSLPRSHQALSVA